MDAIEINTDDGPDASRKGSGSQVISARDPVHQYQTNHDPHFYKPSENIRIFNIVDTLFQYLKD